MLRRGAQARNPRGPRAGEGGVISKVGCWGWVSAEVPQDDLNGLTFDPIYGLVVGKILENPGALTNAMEPGERLKRITMAARDAWLYLIFTQG